MSTTMHSDATAGTEEKIVPVEVTVSTSTNDRPNGRGDLVQKDIFDVIDQKVQESNARLQAQITARIDQFLARLALMERRYDRPHAMNVANHERLEVAHLVEADEQMNCHICYVNKKEMWIHCGHFVCAACFNHILAMSTERAC